MKTGTVKVDGKTVNVHSHGGYVMNEAGQVLVSQSLINSVRWSR